MQNARKSSIIDDLEVLRGLAVLMTVIHHFKQLYVWSPGWLKLLFSKFTFYGGVDLFFAISGFVIGRQVLPLFSGVVSNRDQYLKNTAAFYLRRAYRLWPSAWLWWGFVLLGTFFFNRSGAFGTITSSFIDMTAAVFHVSNFHSLSCYHFGQGICGPYGIHWSLSLEEQIYFILPFVFYFLRNKIILALLIYALVSVLIPHDPWGIFYAIRADAFAFGMLISAAHWKIPAIAEFFEPKFLARSKAVRYALFALFAALLSFVPMGHVGWFGSGLLSMLCAALVLVGSYDRSYIFPEGWIKSIMVWVGQRSYALYLVHLPAFFVTREIAWRVFAEHRPVSRPEVLVYSIGALFFLWAFTEINFRWIERPLREKGKRLAEGFLAESRT